MQNKPYFFGATPFKELKARIDKYLADNKKQKKIDIEKLILSLRSKYPEYEQREKEVFKKQVEKAFKEMAAEVVKKKKKEGESGKEKGKKKGEDYWYYGYYGYYGYYNNWYYGNYYGYYGYYGCGYYYYYCG